MPANRSRTDRWKDSLWKIYERGGGLEFTIDRGETDGTDLVWRVRILNLKDNEIVVELPGAMGKSFSIEAGVNLVGILCVGQNKWMFHTSVIGLTEVHSRHQSVPALRIAMPDQVERCQRRTFDRISTAAIELPAVSCWPLLDPRSAVPAEIANRIMILDMLDQDITGQVGESHPDAMPEVGPSFVAELANLGGGGVGLQMTREAAAAIETQRLFWLQINLAPVIPAPLSMTARLAHTHIDSRQRVYAGMAFDFGLNPSHKTFVIGQIDRYLRCIQRRNAA